MLTPCLPAQGAHHGADELSSGRDESADARPGSVEVAIVQIDAETIIAPEVGLPPAFSTTLLKRRLLRRERREVPALGEPTVDLDRKGVHGGVDARDSA